MAKFCTGCGASMPDEQKFCTECGAPMNAAVQPAAPAAPAQPAAPQYTAPQPAPQQYIPTPAAPAGEPDKTSKYQPITTGGYIGITLLMCIPILGLLLAIIWACGGCRKINKRNLARAWLILMAVALVLSLVLGLVFRSAIGSISQQLGEAAGTSGTGSSGSTGSGLLGGLLGGGDESEEESALGALGALAGLVGGSGEATNGDIEELEELAGLLEGLEGVTGGDASGLEGLINEAADINAEAEAANNGWPKTLRSYPGGTATAVASYRTEISGTSRDEMLGWIEQLRGNGFAYQDFYDFGMTEEDMLSVDGWWATDGEIYLSLSLVGDTLTIDHTTELPDLSGLFG